jgi:hypothetical protein
MAMFLHIPVPGAGNARVTSRKRKQGLAEGLEHNIVISVKTD